MDNNSNPFNNNNQTQPSQFQQPQSQPFGGNVQGQNQSTPLQDQNTPAATTGIFTEGIATAQSAQISAPVPHNHSKKPLAAFTAMIIVIMLGVGSFFLVRNLTSTKKTIVDFEKIITNLGYTKAGSDYASYSDSDGAYTTYAKTDNNNTVTSIAMFYEMKSKDKLKDLIASTVLGNDIDQLLNNFDWSKERNEASRCDQNKLYTCMKIIQIDNTLLTIMAANNTVDATNSEIESITTAMGY